MKRFLKPISVIMIIAMFVTMLTACGKAITVDIVDVNSKTPVEVKTGYTVEKVLETAQITIGDKDETEPALDEKITEETKEIIIKRYAKVTVVKDGKEYEVETVGGTVADALEKAGITLAKDEVTDMPQDKLLEKEVTINVLKQLSVKLTVDGKTKEVFTSAKTVEEFIAEQKVKLGEDDEVNQKSDAKIKNGMKIVVKRVEFKEETKTETIEFSTQEKYSDSMAKGQSKVEREGSNGQKEVTYKVKFVDGEEDSREVVKEKILKEATDKIVVYGTKASSSSSSSSNSGGKTETDRIRVEDCDGSGHGYYEIHYSDGSVAYEEF